MATYKKITITSEFLDLHTDSYFIFGDNLARKGYKGASKLRDHFRTYGFITKKLPNGDDSSFYKPAEYSSVFFEELKKLETFVKEQPNKKFYISKLGSGSANKYRIWELLIQHNLVRSLEKFNNVIFCWREDLTSC